MNHHNPCDDGLHSLSPNGHLEYSNEDKATQTRRKNAEAQKLYRERKKQYEAGLVSKVQLQQERIHQLEAQLAYERDKQNQPIWPPNPSWLEPPPSLPPYSQNQPYTPSAPQTGRCHQHDPLNFGPLDAKFMQTASAANALFQVTYDNPYSPLYSRSSSSSPIQLIVSLVSLDSRSSLSSAQWARSILTAATCIPLRE